MGQIRDLIQGSFGNKELRSLLLKGKETLQLRGIGLLKIPFIFLASPSIIEVTDERCEIRIPLNRLTRNHLRSMYFGVLAVGADIAGGLIAWRLIERSGVRISLAFKDFHAEFMKRAEGAVHFSCEDGLLIRERVDQAISTGERQNFPVHVIARVPSQGEEPVARFTLTLSLKRKAD